MFITQKLLTKIAVILTPIILVYFIAGCKGVSATSRKKSDTPVPTNTGSETETSSTDESAISTGGLAISYPEGLSVANTTSSAPTSSANDPTAVAIASGSLAVPTSLVDSNFKLISPSEYNPAAVAPRERIVEAAKRLKGEADECLPPHLFNPMPPPAPNCYNFDGDLASVYRNYAITPISNPQFQTAGSTTPTGEACMAAYVRAKTAEVAAIVDQAQALVEGMICASYKKDKSQKLPEANETLDLLDALVSATGVTKTDANTDLSSPAGAPTPVNGVPPLSMFRFMKAEIKRLEDTADRSRYISNIIMEVNGTVRHIRLLHMPSITSKNDDYIGRLSIKTVRVQFNGVAENYQNFLDVNYMLDMDGDDTGKPRSRFRLLRAMFNHAPLVANNIDPFAGVGRLNVNIGANFSVATNDPSYGSFPSDAGHDMNYTVSRLNQIEWDGNPITYEGRFSFWINPGGNYNEAARGFVANIQRESPESTRLKGCAVSGAALGVGLAGNYSIRKAQKDNVVLKPTGYYHPGANYDGSGDRTESRCQAGDCQRAPFVYKQCFRQDDEGKYLPYGNSDTTKQYDVINMVSSPTAVNGFIPSVDGKIQSP